MAIADCDAALGPARPANLVTWTDAERYRGLRLSEYAEAARRFVWNELADWYLESIKPRLATPGPDREIARAVLAHAFDGALRLLQPIVPFITEELWQKLPQTPPNAFIAQAAWPMVRTQATGSGAGCEQAREAVQAIRQVAPNTTCSRVPVDVVLVAPAAAQDGLRAMLETIGSLARARVTWPMSIREAPRHRCCSPGYRSRRAAGRHDRPRQGEAAFANGTRSWRSSSRHSRADWPTKGSWPRPRRPWWTRNGPRRPIGAPAPISCAASCRRWARDPTAFRIGGGVRGGAGYRHRLCQSGGAARRPAGQRPAAHRAHHARHQFGGRGPQDGGTAFR